MVIEMVTYEKLYESVRKHKARSAWSKGVQQYAMNLIYDKQDFSEVYVPDIKQFEKVLLNGARDWKEYSWGGCSLIYDDEIAKILCTPSEYKKVHRKDGSLRKPNAREEWLDTQARALYQAFELIKEKYHELEGEVSG